MKQFIFLLLTIALFASCGGDDSNSTPGPNGQYYLKYTIDGQEFFYEGIEEASSAPIDSPNVGATIAGNLQGGYFYSILATNQDRSNPNGFSIRPKDFTPGTYYYDNGNLIQNFHTILSVILNNNAYFPFRIDMSQEERLNIPVMKITSFDGDIIQGEILDNWYYKTNYPSQTTDSIRLTNCSFKLKVIR